MDEALRRLERLGELTPYALLRAGLDPLELYRADPKCLLYRQALALVRVQQGRCPTCGQLVVTEEEYLAMAYPVKVCYRSENGKTPHWTPLPCTCGDSCCNNTYVRSTDKRHSIDNEPRDR